MDVLHNCKESQYNSCFAMNYIIAMILHLVKFKVY